MRVLAYGKEMLGMAGLIEAYLLGGRTWSAMMLLISGSQCPNAFTAIPAVKSRYFLFSTSQR